MLRYDYHIFVCENRRPDDDPKGCCANRGGTDLLTALREQVKAAGLAARVRVNSSGCLANCARGAAMVIYPDAVWYSQVNVADVSEIFAEHIQNGRPVKRLMDPVFHAEPPTS
ncbi:MAG: (2Fe-2S) ferredoxin domain-containing protein [Calditrichaeota bacterium]|nr:(2Fe-2S) ferredoxin domain-containing protein [Calditrichota bacterium]MCB9366272.1 (2Fe-2S) ferredoxin domain-containing protein [Calditrichota bacterium]MCB9391658.1 (2Fe-2S) ferredoxin domain-containing protein [Calditrichota bacterium]